MRVSRGLSPSTAGGSLPAGGSAARGAGSSVARAGLKAGFAKARVFTTNIYNHNIRGIAGNIYKQSVYLPTERCSENATSAV